MVFNVRKGKAQGSPEFMMVISFIFLMFLIVMVIAFQKQAEAYQLQVSLDAQKVARSVADNINMISKNGDGYYRYFSVPDVLFGYTDYEIEIFENFLEIQYSGNTWTTTLVTNNVTIMSFDKGESLENCVSNVEGEVVISDVCGLSDQGCGEVHDCDPGESDTCGTCNTPAPPTINQNSRSLCTSYGCTTQEWHFYTVVPTSSGTLKVTFDGTGTMTGDDKTDMIFHDYNATGCNNPQVVNNLEPITTQDFAVQGGNTYIIALDSDSDNCSEGGSYTLTTKLI